MKWHTLVGLGFGGTTFCHKSPHGAPAWALVSMGEVALKH